MLTGLKRNLMRDVVRMTLLAAAGALVSGCATVGSDFSAPPNLDAPAYLHQTLGAAAAADTSTTAVAHLPQQWWKVFGDAELNRLESLAMTGNPGARAAAQRLLQAKAQTGLVRSSQSPSLNLGAGVSNQRTSANSAQGKALGGQAISGNEYSAGASMAYELDLWGRVRRLVDASDAQALVAESDRDGVMLLLSTQVAQTYWQLRGLDAEMAILNGALGTRRESSLLLEARLDAGLSNELDVARARVERANAEADLHDVQRQRNVYEHSLATLIGVAPSRMRLAPNQAVLPQPPLISVGVPANLLAQRPDLAGSVAALRAANAGVGVAEAAFYPSLQLTGSYGYASESLRQLAQGGSRQFSLGPLALTLPVFDGGRNRANLAVSKARYGEALANHEGKLLTALREVEDALSDLEQRALQGQVQAEARQAAQRAYLVAQARYERGVSNYLDVTDAQRSALAADRTATQITLERLLATVAVARALGGGWQPLAN